MARVVFLTCHLTGTGHLVRTLALARAAHAEGHEATVINGGRPLGHLDVDGVDLVQLPPLTVRGFEFTVLRQPDGTLADKAYMALRAERLGDVMRDRRPDALITELFPFGRRALADEFVQAIALARAEMPTCAILSSVRDVPEPKPRRLGEVADRIVEMFDAVIVHGDPAVIPLDDTWPLPSSAMTKVHYAGYLGMQRSIETAPRGETVLVSVGGGVLGRDLLRIAVDAAAQSERPWHVLVGGADAQEIAASLRPGVGKGRLQVEAARPDYHALLAQAACSVSLCGYNTALDLAVESVPAILVPSEEADEQEQLIRAKAWAHHDGVALIRQSDVTPSGLASLADTMAKGRTASAVIDRSRSRCAGSGAHRQSD